MQIRSIPWYGLGAIYEQDDINAVLDILQPCVTEAKGFFRLPEEPDFQKAFAAHEDCSFASAVNSCGTGLDLMLKVLGIGPGDEVITTPLTFVCTGTCILATGAVPVFCDIDPRTYNLDPAKAAACITERTKAILPVHFAGLPADIDGFAALAARHNLKVIYDAAHAAGARYNGRGVGGFGDMSAYSFQSNKNMSTLGEGGAVTTNNADYFADLEKLKSFGFRYGPVDEVVMVGYNYRMTKLQSAVGMTQLEKLARNNQIRRQYCQYLTEQLADVEEITTPVEPQGCESAWHLYTLLIDEDQIGTSRDAFMQKLQQDYQIGIRMHYKPVYHWQVFQDLGYDASHTPIAEQTARRLFNPPVFANLQPDDLDYMVWAMKDCITACRKEG